MVAVCKDLCVFAPLRLCVKIGRAEIKGSGRAAAGGARPSPAAAMSRRQRAFANPMPDGFATLLGPGTGALRRLLEPFRLGNGFWRDAENGNRDGRAPQQSPSRAVIGSLGWTNGAKGV
jgi:hypothetical protein